MGTSQGLMCPVCPNGGLRVDVWDNDNNTTVWTCISCAVRFPYPAWQQVGGTLWPVVERPDDFKTMTLAQARKHLATIGLCETEGHMLRESYATLHERRGGVSAVGCSDTPRTIHIYRCARCGERYLRDGYVKPEFPGSKS